MRLLLQRYSSGEDTTLGLLFDDTGPASKRFLCYTLEDEHRELKVYGETRIPSGEYDIELRTVGGKHAKYGAKYPDMHKGMLWLQDVPNFEYVLIHVGNTDADTEGCILVGNSAVENVVGEGSIGSSVNAYKRVYPPIATAIERGERVTIRIEDHG